MPVLMTSDLKARAGEILDAAKDAPQFIFRNGQIFMLSPVQPSEGVRILPNGYFFDAYENFPEERNRLETAAAAVSQKAER